jgi:hypothetical protein
MKTLIPDDFDNEFLRIKDNHRKWRAKMLEKR